MRKTVTILVLVCLCGLAMAGPEQKQPREPKGGRLPQAAMPADVQRASELSLVLGCPTDSSIVVSILSSIQYEGLIEYGSVSGKYTGKTATISATAGKPIEVVIDKLKADTLYFYRLSVRKPGETAFSPGQEYSFRTQRPPGSTFTFEIQGDSHPERRNQFDPSLYARTLRGAAGDHPDFYMTIGDDFSVDTLRQVNADTVGAVYLDQRHYLSLVGQSSPLFLVNGNHEQAAMCNLDGSPNNVAVWAGNSRNKYFPLPAPDGFYTGDAQKVEHIDLLRDYYAWTWGDALFVVIDPYWHSAKPVDNVYGGGQKNRDMWAITLGDAQYRWFERTLRQSKAKYKFVFTHHVLGTGRGGIEEAGLFEWGGKDKRGVDSFAQRRPGWDRPIHQLMAETGVTIFFQGHDHVFARQQLGGVTYQTLAEPADPSYALYNAEAYTSGDIFPNSGRVRVTVAPQDVKVEYVRSWLPKDETPQHKSGEVAFSYTVKSNVDKVAK
jgi:hypothetical protein